MSVFTEKDLIPQPRGAGGPTPSSNAFFDFLDRAITLSDYVLQILEKMQAFKDNPMLAQIIASRVDKRMAMLAPQPQPSLPPPAINPETVYNQILNALDGFTKVAGDMSLSEAADFLRKKKTIALKAIEGAMKGQSVTPVDGQPSQ